jgi:hypothetical protein
MQSHALSWSNCQYTVQQTTRQPKHTINSQPTPDNQEQTTTTNISDNPQSTESTRQPTPDNQKERLILADTTDNFNINTRQPTPNNRHGMKSLENIAD